MTRSLVIGGPVSLALMALALLGCTALGDSAATPNASPTRTPATMAPSPDDEPRFLIDCLYRDSSSAGTFTRLEEAWASPNYLRIDRCDARAASDTVELTPEEEAIATVAAKDLPDEAPVDLYLRTLAACVRIAPDAAKGVETYPTSLLEAALQLCAEAPHAGLIEAELGARGGLTDAAA